VKSEYTANAYFIELRRLEAKISREAEPGYDPYNSADRFRWPDFGGNITVELLEVDGSVAASFKFEPPLSLVIPGKPPLTEFAPDEFDVPPLGPGPLSPQQSE